MSKKTFNIEISIDTLKKRIEKVFVSSKEPHAKLLSKMIMANLTETEVGIKQVFLAFLGIEETIPYMVGDNIIVNSDYLPTWRWNKERMKELIVNKTLKAKITEIYPHKNFNIGLSYQCYKDGFEELQEDTSTIQLSNVIQLDSKGTIARPDISEIL